MVGGERAKLFLCLRSSCIPFCSQGGFIVSAIKKQKKRKGYYERASLSLFFFGFGHDRHVYVRWRRLGYKKLCMMNKGLCFFVPCYFCGDVIGDVLCLVGACS